MESSFRGERHAHTCAGCLHWAATLLTDAFQRSRWAHQIRIHIFTLDLNECLCESTEFSPDILRLKLFLCYIRGCITLADSLTARGPSEVVTRTPHPISASKQLTQLLFSQRQRVCRRLRCNQNSWENRIFYMQNKQCGGNKTFRRAVRSFQESI